MDPERQPLLYAGPSNTNTRYGPLTYEEVIKARQDPPWRRARILLILMFWGIIAMFLSVVVSMLITAPKCPNEPDLGPFASVPPSHLSFAPLISKGRQLNDNVYVL